MEFVFGQEFDFLTFLLDSFYSQFLFLALIVDNVNNIMQIHKL